jgi:hypothetical protein
MREVAGGSRREHEAVDIDPDFRRRPMLACSVQAAKQRELPTRDGKLRRSNFGVTNRGGGRDVAWCIPCSV